MKLNKIFFAAAALVLGLVACQTEQEWEPTPADEGLAVYFAVADESGEEVQPGTKTSHSVVVKRHDAAEALELKIAVTLNDSNVFIVPETVTFAAGEDNTVLTFGIDIAKMVDGVEYKLNLALDPDKASIYSKTAYKYSLTQVLPVHQGVFVDKFWSGATFVVNYNIVEEADGSQKITLLSPYTTASANQEPDENGVYDAIPSSEITDEGKYNLTILVDANGNADLQVAEFGITYQGYAIWGGMLDALFGQSHEDEGAYGAGVCTPGVNVIFDGVAGAVINADGGVSYFDVEFYFSKEAYVESTTVEGSGCEISDYEGSFTAVTVDMFATEPAPAQTPVSIAYYADYGLYLIQGLPDASVIAATFDAATQLMNIPAQLADSVTIEGVGYETIFYPMSPTGGLSQDPIVCIANEDGTVTVDASSKAIGYFLLLAQNGQPVTDAEGYVQVLAGYQLIGFAPAATEGAKPALKKVPAKFLQSGKKFKSVLPLLNVNNLFIK